MKHPSFPLVLACALSLSLLASCGNGASSSQSSTSSDQSSISSSQTGATSSDNSPDLSLPGSSSSVEGSASSGSSSQGSALNEPSIPTPEQAAMTLNRSDFSLFTVGSTFRLKAANVPQGESVTWSSSNDAVATVGEDGTVTYVAPGSVTITATAGDQTVTCKVYCKAQEETKPDNSGSSSTGGSSSGSASGDSSSSSSARVDLSDFAATAIANYSFPSFMQLADKATQDTVYPGLSDIATEQCLVYANQMSMNNGELVLVQVKDSKDVDAVKSILQTRIDNMINGGAWYPEPTRLWTECSQVVSNGNYVMMVFNESYSSVVKDFNALF